MRANDSHNNQNSKTVHNHQPSAADHPMPVLHGTGMKLPFVLKPGAILVTKKREKLIYSTVGIGVRIDSVMRATAKGIERALEEGVRRANTDSSKAAGHMMEVMHVSTYNIDASFKGTGAMAVMTADLGRTSDPVDIIVTHGKETLSVQAKNTITESTATLARRAGDAKYAECGQIIVPEDKLEKLQAYAQGRLDKPSVNPNALLDSEAHSQIVDKATSKIEFKGSSSKPMTGQQAKDYAESPNSSKRDLLKHGGVRVAALSGGTAALAAGLSMLTSKEKDLGKRAREAGVAGLKAGGSSAATALGVGVLRTIGQNGGRFVQPLARGNVAGLVLQSGLIISQEGYKYCKGECTGAEAADRIAEKGSGVVGGLLGVAGIGGLIAAAPVSVPLLLTAAVVTGGSIGGSIGAGKLYKAAKKVWRNW